MLKVALPDADPSLPDISTGNPKAAITVIEYGSVACPICAMVNQDIMPGFFATYVATGKVRFIYRPMQTGNPAVARLGHALAECAGRDKYFSVIDTIMRAQPEMDQGGQPEQYINAP
ncbi:MAG: thioredoxin domain-containing protein, partial [Asticcacaulis sp.]|nr:thioredoxin domain-containing protein [Asticcacaulis sp.]